MPELFINPFADGLAVNPLHVFVRLLVALALGGVVAWVYRKSTPSSEMGATFPTTLTMLAVLIAMVTQVVGDSVARAFSLVGALSIVRFRTVVRDTRDTAYVIFAVAVGMAVGAHNVWTALLGLGLVSAFALIVSARRVWPAADDPPFLLRVTLGLGYDLEKSAGALLDQYLLKRRMVALESAKKGTALEYTFEGQFKEGVVPEELVKRLHHTEGVYEVRLERQPEDRA